MPNKTDTHGVSKKTLQQKLLKIREKMDKLYSEEQAVKENLRGNCDHSRLEDYPWEHDNGYGRQSQMTGARCTFCGWIDLWNRNKFSDPRNIDV